jgi:hypothetical protein
METKLKTLINKLVQEELSLMEKKKKKEPIELDIDTTIEEPSAEEATAELAAEPAAPIDGDMDMDMSGGDSTEKTIGKGLQMALDAAKQLPDNEMKSKLIRQIGNTALFFLKTQIPTSGEQM